MVRTALVVVLALTRLADAQEPTTEAPKRTARDYAKHSTTAYLQGTTSPGPMVPIRVGAETALRLHRNHVAIEGRLGIGGAATLTGFAGETIFHGGLSFGFAVAISKHVAIAPMAAYDAFVEWQPYGTAPVTHYATFELPLSIVLDRVVIEPFVQVGAAFYLDTQDLVVIAGPRIGVTF